MNELQLKLQRRRSMLEGWSDGTQPAADGNSSSIAASNSSGATAAVVGSSTAGSTNSSNPSSRRPSGASETSDASAVQPKRSASWIKQNNDSEANPQPNPMPQRSKGHVSSLSMLFNATSDPPVVPSTPSRRKTGDFNNVPLKCAVVPTPVATEIVEPMSSDYADSNKVTSPISSKSSETLQSLNSPSGSEKKNSDKSADWTQQEINMSPLTQGNDNNNHIEQPSSPLKPQPSDSSLDKSFADDIAQAAVVSEGESDISSEVSGSEILLTNISNSSTPMSRKYLEPVEPPEVVERRLLEIKLQEFARKLKIHETMERDITSMRSKFDESSLWEINVEDNSMPLLAKKLRLEFWNKRMELLRQFEGGVNDAENYNNQRTELIQIYAAKSKVIKSLTDKVLQMHDGLPVAREAAARRRMEICSSELDRHKAVSLDNISKMKSEIESYADQIRKNNQTFSQERISAFSTTAVHENKVVYEHRTASEESCKLLVDSFVHHIHTLRDELKERKTLSDLWEEAEMDEKRWNLVQMEDSSK